MLTRSAYQKGVGGSVAEIDTGLLLLVVIGAIALIGLILALQTNVGRKRLAAGGLRLAEALIALAVRWLEQVLPDEAVEGVAILSGDVDRARTALKALRG